jgi:hypothetical protein
MSYCYYTTPYYPPRSLSYLDSARALTVEVSAKSETLKTEKLAGKFILFGQVHELDVSKEPVEKDGPFCSIKIDDFDSVIAKLGKAYGKNRKNILRIEIQDCDRISPALLTSINKQFWKVCDLLIKGSNFTLDDAFVTALQGFKNLRCLHLRLSDNGFEVGQMLQGKLEGTTITISSTDCVNEIPDKQNRRCSFISTICQSLLGCKL